MTQPDPRQTHDDDEARFAAFMRKMPELIAKRESAEPVPPRPPQAWVDKPPALVGAEAELFRCELTLRIWRLLCSDIARCKHRRCRRTKRCRELDAMRPLEEAARAELARQQAKWQPPAGTPAGKPSGKRRRTGARR